MHEVAVGKLLHKRGWRKAFTIREMVDKWDWLVGTVEGGYDDVVEEYTNDLCCRNWLYEAWLLLDDDPITIWSPRILAVDDRFRLATIDDDGFVISQFHRVDDPAQWWWRRYPRNLTGDLGRSLRSAGATG